MSRCCYERITLSKPYLKIPCHDILLALDSGNLALLTLLDLSTAFDSVDHATLLRRLQKSYGLGGAVLDWFASYLSGRTQYVRTPATSSEPSICSVVWSTSRLGPRTYPVSTLHCRCAAACERPRTSAPCICRRHSDPRRMSYI